MFPRKQFFSKFGKNAPVLSRITGDFAVNILASVIYTFARQIVVFPLLAARLPEDTYGTLLTVTGLVTKLSHIEGAAKSVDLSLSSEEIAYLEEPYVPHRLVGVMAQKTCETAAQKHVWSVGNQSV